MAEREPGQCAVKGCTNRRESKGLNRQSGVRYYGSYCTTHRRSGVHWNIDRAKCSRCGFVAEEVCQIDIDHIDGDRSNNSPDNLVALCANCHRLKTKQSGDWCKKGYADEQQPTLFD